MGGQRGIDRLHHAHLTMTTPSLRPASFGARVRAFGIDYLIMSAYIVFLTLAGALAPKAWVAELMSSPVRAQVVIFLILTLPIIMYFAVLEATAAAGSVGKRRLGLRVVRTSGERVGFLRSLVRSALKFLPWELAHTCLWHIEGWPTRTAELSPGVIAGFVSVWVLVAAYLITMRFSTDRRTPYDQITDCVVVPV